MPRPTVTFGFFDNTLVWPAPTFGEARQLNLWVDKIAEGDGVAYSNVVDYFTNLVGAEVLESAGILYSDMPMLSILFSMAPRTVLPVEESEKAEKENQNQGS